MYYVFEVIRNEDQEVIDHVIIGANSQGSGPRGKELIFIRDSRDLDLQKIRVAFTENGSPMIEEDPDKVAAIEAEGEIALRIRRIEFGKRLIAIMSIRNDTKGFSVEEIVEFRNTFADIDSALLNGSIGTAKALINAIEPDGTITTEGDKAAMLDEITANEPLLGYEV